MEGKRKRQTKRHTQVTEEAGGGAHGRGLGGSWRVGGGGGRRGASVPGFHREGGALSRLHVPCAWSPTTPDGLTASQLARAALPARV